VNKITKDQEEINEIRKVIHSLSSEIQSTENLLKATPQQQKSKRALRDMQDVPSSTFEIELGSLPQGFYSTPNHFNAGLDPSLSQQSTL